MCHNLGQMAVCLAVYRSWAVAVYIPVLLLSGIVTGLFTGLTAQFLLKRLQGRL